ncbi:MAG: membrane protein [Gammaproteobacteria bacterium]|nr:MAG: membrane protein [Gammaproteobacteria bacterium]
MRLTKSKNGSLFLVFIYYISSFYLAYLLIKNIDLNGWLLILAWHIFATLIIFMFSNIHKNSSIYDPFWHVAPIPIVFYTADQSTLPVMELYLVLSAFLFWSLRLTYNWYLNWTNLDHEDFRYIDLKNNNRFLAFINDLFGIHLIPTLIVNASLYPIYIALTSDSLSNLVYVGFILIIVAVTVQYISDDQMRKFRKDDNNFGKTMKYGLWKYSRHPNYFGEVSFWFGIYLFALASGETSILLLACPMLMLALFVFISCPMMDNRSLKKRSDYREYMKKTPQLFMWFVK